MEDRVARLEVNVEHMRSDIAEIRTDVRDMRQDVKRLDEKITAVDTNLSGRITDFEKSVSDRFSTLTIAMEKGFARMDFMRMIDRIWSLLISAALLAIMARAFKWI